MNPKKLKMLVISLVVLATGGIFFLAPIAQDPSYHHFADTRLFWSIPNFWNVVSNALFFVFGAYGVYLLHATQRLHIVRSMKVAYSIFFVGVALVAFGSGYYHWAPSNETLLWDRLPMTLAFMALMSITSAEFLSLTWGRMTLWPLLVAGLLSVVYWYVGELDGAGDLRPYVLVQFLPIILILVLLVAGRNVFDMRGGYAGLFACYVAAKLLEHFDAQVYDAFAHVISGHSLKHMVAAFGVLALLRSFERRHFK